MRFFPANNRSVFEGEIFDVNNPKWELEFLSILKKNGSRSISVCQNSDTVKLMPKLSTRSSFEVEDALSLLESDLLEYLVFGFDTVLDFKTAEIVSDDLEFLEFAKEDAVSEIATLKKIQSFLEESLKKLKLARVELPKKTISVIVAEIIAPGPNPTPIPTFLPLLFLVPKLEIKYTKIIKKILKILEDFPNQDISVVSHTESNGVLPESIIEFETLKKQNMVQRVISGSSYWKDSALSALRLFKKR